METAQQPPRSRWQQWYLVLTLAVLNATNASLWISYSSIADLTQLYYNISADAVNWLALVYPIAALPLGLPIAFCLDRWGVRAGLLIGAIFNAAGGCLRYAAGRFAAPYNYWLVFGGQCLAAIAQPLFMFSPTAAAAEFPVSQRATANMIGSMSNPLGILATNLASPLLVKSPDHLPIANFVYGAGACAALLFAIVAAVFTKRTAPTINNSESSSNNLSFSNSMKQCITQLSFWLLLISAGCGMGLFTALSALLQQILCPFGYDDQFAGICGAVLIGAGLVGAGVAGVIADASAEFDTLAKICFSLAAVASAAFAALLGQANAPAIVLTTISCFGCFGFAFYPLALELAAECTFPAGEAVSTGLLVIAGQLASVLFMIISQLMASEMLHPPASKCAVPPAMDFRAACCLFAAVAAALSIAFTVLFRAKYLRRIAHTASANAGANYDANADSYMEDAAVNTPVTA